jgi:hypothetical protein
MDVDVNVPDAGSTRLLGQVANFGGGAVTINKTGQSVGASFLALWDIGPTTHVPTALTGKPPGPLVLEPGDDVEPHDPPLLVDVDDAPPIVVP